MPAFVTYLNPAAGTLTLYRFVLRAAHNSAKVRTGEQWHPTSEAAEESAKRIAVEWGGKRPMKVALVYPVPAMQNARHEAAGAP